MKANIKCIKGKKNFKKKGKAKKGKTFGSPNIKCKDGCSNGCMQKGVISSKDNKYNFCSPCAKIFIKNNPNTVMKHRWNKCQEDGCIIRASYGTINVDDTFCYICCYMHNPQGLMSYRDYRRYLRYNNTFHTKTIDDEEDLPVEMYMTTRSKKNTTVKITTHRKEIYDKEVSSKTIKKKSKIEKLIKKASLVSHAHDQSRYEEFYNLSKVFCVPFEDVLLNLKQIEDF